jgi:hypothetical protein
MKPNHEEILLNAKLCAKKPEDVPKIETLHQNICHMTVALKVVETRLLRATNKMNRLKIENDEDFLVPLAKCVSILKNEIEVSKKALEKY